MCEPAIAAAARLHEDAWARAQALQPGSFIVEAPAGAGKTELLTQRFLARLAGVAEPEEVIALTFTQKAAAEMRARIEESLRLPLGTARETLEPHKQVTYDLARKVLQQDEARGWNLGDNPGRLAVTTLDALCMGLVRQMPLLSRFGTAPRIAEKPEQHYEAAAQATLELLEDAAHADTVAGALTALDNHTGRFTRLLVAMLGRRDQWWPHGFSSDDGQRLRQAAEAGLQELILRDLDQSSCRWGAAIQSALMAAARYAAAQTNGPTALADWREPCAARIEDLPCWRALADLVLTRDGALRKTLNAKNGFPATPEGRAHRDAVLAALNGIGDEAAAALARIRRLPEPRYGEADWAAVEVFAHVLRLAAAQLWLIFGQAGEVDFIEIAQRALQALGSEDAPTDLALALDRRISHLLVDEFQDTSPTQVRLLEALMRGWQSDEIASGQRSLFLVGDPMQSIYRFRKADVGQFLRVRDHGIAPVRLTPLRLYRNNRSDPALVQWVNDTFPAIFAAEDDPLSGAVRHAEAATDRLAADAAAVQVHALPGAAAEADAILTLIRAERARDPAAKIAVLVRARSHLAALAAALRAAGRENGMAIPVAAQEIDALSERQAIADLLSLARALLHRADRVHWLACLRAPWCGLTLNDLHALAGADHHSTLWQLLNTPGQFERMSPDGQARAGRLRAIFANAFNHQGRLPARRWVEAVWRQLGGPLCAAHEAADCAAFFDLLDRLEAADALTPEALEARVAELFAAPDASPAAQQVQLMTIHKAKGLEFDVVIVPGLDRRPRGVDSELLVWQEVVGEEAVGDDEASHGRRPPESLLMAAALGSPVHAYLKDLEQTRSGHETTRLLYVAATRAKLRLHLFAALDRNTPEPARNSFLERLWAGAVGTELRRQMQAWADAAADETIEGTDMNNLADALPLRRLPLTALPVVAARAPHAPGAGVPAAKTAETLEMAVGTVVHRSLELIAGESLHGNLAAWTPVRIRALRPAYRYALEQAGRGPAQAEAGSATVVAALCATLESEGGRWVLQAHKGAGAEQAWFTAGEEGPQQRIIDRTFIADGERWIVDYKTVQAGAGDLRAIAEGYRDQLEGYAGLFRDEGVLVRMAILFCLQGALIELTAG